MGRFANFIDRVWNRKINQLDARATRAGKAAEALAKQLARVDTGNMRSLVGFYYDQSTRTMTLYAEAPYSHFVERRYPFMRPAWNLMRTMFKGTSEMQFSTLPEQYQAGVRAAAGPGVVIGRRAPRRGR
jgi:hypothetical protein